MTKPKISNGTSLNPLSRLEKRLEECKNHHNESIANCNKIQESHNKKNLELKLSLERKSKISDSKIKKKRSTNGTSVNRKKAKIIPEKIQTKQFFEDCLESTPNVSLNVHSSEYPDFDLDTLDILKDPNFSMSINEQELDGVLNNCCPQSTLTNDPFSSELIYSYKSSTQVKPEPITSNLGVNNIKINNGGATSCFKIEETTQTPLFPPPEIPVQSRMSSNVNVDYPSSLSYNTNNANYQSNIMPNQVRNASLKLSDNLKYNPNMYSVNVPLNTSLTNHNTQAPYSYQYSSTLNNTLAPELSTVVSNGPGNNAQQYFYQYVNFPNNYHQSKQISSTNDTSNFQLPTMSSGWYNNPPSQPVKRANCKSQIGPQPPVGQFVSVPPSTSSTYHHNGFSHYQLELHQPAHGLQCQPVYNSHYDTGPTAFPQPQPPPIATNQPNATNNQGYSNLNSYGLMPSDQNSYYYVDYSGVVASRNTTGNGSSTTGLGLPMITQNDPQFPTNHNSTITNTHTHSNHNNPGLCRNLYQSHCL